MKKFLITASIAVALFFSTSVWTNAQAPRPEPQTQPQAQPQAQPPQQPAQRAESVTGKVTAVSGRTFSIETGEGTSKKTMQFTSSTDLAENIKVGSTVTVEYRAGANNQNMATKVDVRG